MPRNKGWWTFSDIFMHAVNFWFHHRGTKWRCFIFLWRNHPCTGSVLRCFHAFQKNKKNRRNMYILQWYRKGVHMASAIALQMVLLVHVVFHQRRRLPLHLFRLCFLKTWLMSEIRIYTSSECRGSLWWTYFLRSCFASVAQVNDLEPASLTRFASGHPLIA